MARCTLGVSRYEQGLRHSTESLARCFSQLCLPKLFWRESPGRCRNSWLVCDKSKSCRARSEDDVPLRPVVCDILRVGRGAGEPGGLAVQVHCANVPEERRTPRSFAPLLRCNQGSRHLFAPTEGRVATVYQFRVDAGPQFAPTKGETTREEGMMRQETSVSRLTNGRWGEKLPDGTLR